MSTALIQLQGQSILFTQGQCLDPFRPSVLNLTPAVEAWVEQGLAKILRKDPGLTDQEWGRIWWDAGRDLNAALKLAGFVDAPKPASNKKSSSKE